jgi:hypothetical protein
MRVVPAETPHEPYAPRMKLLIMLGAGLGLLFAVGIIALVEYLRQHSMTRVKATARVQEVPLGGRHQALDDRTAGMNVANG